MRRRAQRGGGFYTNASEDETNAALLKKLDAMDRHRSARRPGARANSLLRKLGMVC
jgi:hypothetical protein